MGNNSITVSVGSRRRLLQELGKIKKDLEKKGHRVSEPLIQREVDNEPRTITFDIRAGREKLDRDISDKAALK